MSRRNGLRLNYFISASLILLSLLLAIAWLVSRYPWPIFLSDFSSARESSFVGHWPLPAMEEDRQERKKLKRFPRSEQQRRLGVLMRRMDYLTVPLFDFFLDPGVQFITPELPAGVSAASPLIWPALPTKRRMGSDDSAYKDIRYVVMPTASGAQCVEGVGMTAGEELRVNLPVARNKRNIVFTVLPLAPSNLRAWLGQFSWARQFNDADVNRMQSVSIPVNDPAASLLRLSLGSGNLLLISASISQWDRSGRLPVQIGLQSSMWKSANESSDANQETVTSNVEPSSEELPLSEDLQTQASTPQLATTAGNESNPQQPASAAGNSAVPSPTPAAPVVSETRAVKMGDSAKGKESKLKAASPSEDMLDPASVKFNPVLPVSGSKTVAIGYNVLMLQLDPLMNTALADESLFASLAPNLHGFMNQALSLPVRLPIVKDGSELFQHSIVRQFGDFIPVGLPILTKDLIAGQSVFNLYQEFRNFGFKVASFAPPAALSLPDALSQGHEVPKVDGKWLDGNDWKFVARRKELDQQNEPASGLEAIFKSERGTSVAAMNENDFLKMSQMLEGLERQSDSIPDWKANELSVVSAKGPYLPRLIDSFQRWTKENNQVRFLAHLYLQNDDSKVRPSFKDFLQVLKFKKFKAIALPGTAEKYARIVMMDRVFGSILDTLVARRTFHRTVISIILPGQTQDKKLEDNVGRFLLGIPGLSGQRIAATKVHSFDDALSTMAQTVGVQFNRQDVDGRLLFRGEGLDSDKSPSQKAAQVVESTSQKLKDNGANEKKTENATTKETDPEPSKNQVIQTQIEVDAAQKPKQVSRYRMIVLPRAAGCQPFEWITSTQYFGLTSSQPIVEEPIPRGKVIRVFPCGLRDQVIELSWFQNHDGPSVGGINASSVANWLGGTLHLNSVGNASDSQDAPFFLVGPQALGLDSLPMRLETFLPTEVPQLFDIETRKGLERETLARILNLNTQMQSAQLSARTLIYFFREPVRR